MAIEVTNKILGSTAAKRSTRVDVANQHPFVFDLQQVRAFPYTTMITIFTTEAAFLLPVLQVGR